MFVRRVLNTIGGDMRFIAFLGCIVLVCSVAFGEVTTPIYDIQYTVEPSGDSPLDGQTVTIEGVVTAANYNGFFVTDAAGPWNSIFVYTQADGCDVEAGDGVTVTGVVDEYYNMTELTRSGDATPIPVSCSITSSGNAFGILPLSTVDIAQEQYESLLVEVVDADVVSLGDHGMWTVDDGSGAVPIDDDMDYLYAPVVADGLASITGVVVYSFSEFKINPRFSSDIVPDDPSPHYAVFGDIVTMNGSLDVLGDHYIEIQDGKIVSISGTAPSGVQVVDVKGLIFPGLIDPHNHPQYNVLGHIPFPGTFVDRADWQDDPMYGDFNTQYYGIRDYGGDDAQYENIWKLAEVRAMAAGTTMIQGSNTFSHSSDSHARLGIGINNVGRFPSHAYSSTFPLTYGSWDSRSAEFWNRFTIHLSEGISAGALNELDTWDGMGLLDDRTTIIHGVPYGPAEWVRLAAADAHLVWSPMSNWVLYEDTANVPQAIAAGVNVALSPDWTPSGAPDLLEEMRFAEQINQAEWAGVLTPEFFAKSVTRNAAMAMGIHHRTGQIAVGFDADLAVFPGDSVAPYEALMAASAKTVRLTVVAGIPRYGDPDLMDQFTFLENVEDLNLCGHTKRLTLAVDHFAIPESGTPFADILAALQTAYDATTPQLCEFLGLDPCKGEGLFGDGFESGDMLAWDSTAP